MTVYSIRKTHFEELGLCVSVIRQSFITVSEEFGLTLQNCPTNGAFVQVERLIADWNQGAGLYGLYCNEELIGFMELKRKDLKVFELEKLCVLPQHRHLGNGELLLDFARKEVTRMGGNKIMIGIIDNNTRLKEWYLKHGYIHVNTANLAHLPFIVGLMEMII
ncbi:MAG: GNAT family N-acetyltransferase [Chitinophagales bacterium]